MDHRALARFHSTAHTGLILMRGAAVVVSLLCYYYAVSVIPLAEAVLLNFSAPIFVPVLGSCCSGSH